MLLQEPGHSPYDLNFQFLGFPVRITWGFWVAGVIFGYNLVQVLDQYFGQSSPGVLPLLMLWGLCLFVSILIHELGHALAFRQYGIESSIVIYHFGGLAVPRTTYSGRSPGSLRPKQDMWIAFAGPLAQVASAAILALGMKAAGYRLLVFDMMPGPFHKIPGVLEGSAIDSPGLFALVTFYIFPSVLWAILNLVPVWPLDGGRIMSAIVHLQGGNLGQTLMISVVVAGLMTLFGFRSGQTYMGILFLMLGITNFQQLQQYGGWRF